jgi:predicted O-methyltransferase YrrM
MTKLMRLLALLPTRPTEFYGRLQTMVETRIESHLITRPTYLPIDWQVLVEALDAFFGTAITEILGEDELKCAEEEIRRGLENLPKDAPFALFHNGDLRLGRLCYALARASRPSVIVETGVCYGVTSTFLLKAIQVNGQGVLHSIDLPPLGKGADDFVGRLVPRSLRPQWMLHRGRSQDLLPEIVQQAGTVDFFLHDSLHTYRNMRREFEEITPSLSTNAVVVADDVEGNSAFAEWVAGASPAYSAVIQEGSKASLLGMALFLNRSVTRPESGS